MLILLVTECTLIDDTKENDENVSIENVNSLLHGCICITTYHAEEKTTLLLAGIQRKGNTFAYIMGNTFAYIIFLLLTMLVGE